MGHQCFSIEMARSIAAAGDSFKYQRQEILYNTGCKTGTLSDLYEKS